MTTGQSRALLERIIRFDKKEREITLEPNSTVILYSPARSMWEIIPTDPGNTILITNERIPVTATPEELEPLLSIIPAPGTPALEQMKLLLAPEELREILRLVERARRVLSLDQALAPPSPEGLDVAFAELVDAAGLLSRLASPDAQGKKNNITERGFFVEGGADVPPSM